jgi:hypothetical protein
MKKILLMLLLVPTLAFADEKFKVVENVPNVSYMEVPVQMCNTFGHSQTCSFGYNKVPVPGEGFTVKIKSLEDNRIESFQSKTKYEVGSLILVKD